MVFKKIIFQNRYEALETPRPPFMAKAILNFHFDYLTPSLTKKTLERILRNHSCAPLHKCGCDTFKWNTMRSEEAEVGLGARDKHR